MNAAPCDYVTQKQPNEIYIKIKSLVYYILKIKKDVWL